MNKRRTIIAGIIALALPGCATVLDGTSQKIAFDTNPQGSVCMLERDSAALATVTTPETIKVKKTKHDIHVNCTKDGYHPSVAHLKSKIEGSTWGNILLGGGIGWAVDSAAGSDNEYEDYVTISMVPLTAAAPAVAVIQPKGVVVSEGAAEATAEPVDETAAEAVEEAGDVAADEPSDEGASEATLEDAAEDVVEAEEAAASMAADDPIEANAGADAAAASASVDEGGDVEEAVQEPTEADIPQSE